MLDKLTTPEFLTACAALVSALSWPVLIAAILWLGRTEIASLLKGIESLTVPDGSSVKFHRAVNRAVLEAINEESKERGLPTERQFQIAERVGQLAKATDLSVVRQQVDAFAAEYDGFGR